MTTQELKDRIIDWEHNAGESFNDCFTHDNVKDVSWAFWLLGKGYNDHALVIIEELGRGETCLDQELLYDIYPLYDGSVPDQHKENYNKNVELIAEFLLDTPYYTKMVEKFLEEE